MSTKDVNIIKQIGESTVIDKQINPFTDRRAKMIYDRYCKGKSIIMDDLRYLFKHDFEGCNELAKNIVEQFVGKEIKNELSDPYEIMIRNADNSNNQIKNLGYSSLPDIPVNSSNISEIMKSAKLKLETMSDQDLSALLDSLNDETELKDYMKKMKNWDDTIVDKMVVYTYEDEKTFSLLA